VSLLTRIRISQNQINLKAETDFKLEYNSTVSLGWQPLNKISCKLLLKMTIIVCISWSELIVEY